MRHEIRQLVHDVDTQLPVRDPNVDVHAEDEESPGDIRHLRHQCLIAFLVRDQLVPPARERMSSGGRDPVAAFVGDLSQNPSEACDLLPGLRDVSANRTTDFHLGLEELGFDLIPEEHGPLLKELGDKGSQLPGLRIDDLKLFLDADRQFTQAHIYPFGTGGSAYS